MMRYLTLLLVLISGTCFANMASPFGEGTKVASVFSSRDVDILSEKIDVTPDRQFKMASYIVEYTIKTDSEGLQIPLLFYAVNYASDFKVWLDGVPISLDTIPQKYTRTEHTPFKGFYDAFERKPDPGRSQDVVIDWSEHTGNVYSLSDLKYFEAKLTKGEHKIRVEYIANVWISKTNWIKTYSFNYSLSPAKYWRSFGTLLITLHNTSLDHHITTNLGKATDSVSVATQTWNFTDLPGETFVISFTPKVNGFANLLLNIQPLGLTIIFTLIIVILHVLLIRRYRKQRPEKKYSPIVATGSWLVPLFALIFFLNTFSIIDSAIGNEASNFHGYVFAVIFLYPFMIPVYWLVTWLVDRYFKKKFLAH